MAADTLADLLDGIGRGRRLSGDGGVLVVPPPSPRTHAVLGFTGHHVIVTDAEEAWVRAQLPPGDLSAPLNPPFLTALGARCAPSSPPGSSRSARRPCWSRRSEARRDQPASLPGQAEDRRHGTVNVGLVG
jgi:hypothetical protein